MFSVVNRRRSLAAIRASHPNAEIVDVTSRGPQPWVAFSPFYPHGAIPVPGREDLTSCSVEGLWQALKVFDGADVDLSRLSITTMRGIKRTVRRYGPVRGHRYGEPPGRLLDYRAARYAIYLPAYRWVLENRLTGLVERLREHEDVVLLDYTVNADPDDLATPLSHAGLLRRWLQGNWPTGPYALT